MDQNKKCKHAACNCMASGKDAYCSQRCKDAKNVTELTCQCGHSACQAGGTQA